MEKLQEKITGWFRDRYEGSPFFLVDIHILPGNKIEVFADGDEGLTIDKCTEISRHLEFFLDHDEDVPEKYILEVSSPGVGKPLLKHRQFIKNRGRKLELNFHDGAKVEGLLEAVDEEGLTLKIKEVRKENKKKIREEVLKKFSLTEIKEAKVKVSF